MLMCFVDFNEFRRLMQLVQLTYISEYIEMAKNGDFSTIFIETPWYDRAEIRWLKKIPQI